MVTVPLLALGAEPLHLERIAAALTSSMGPADADASPDSGPAAPTETGRDGAVVTFLGLVRNHNLGRSVRYLEYEAYEPLALNAFERIAAEIAERWPSARLALHHRIGRIEVGEASVAIATRSPHRGDAYASCRYAIERIKQIAPIWKREFFEGGDVWIEGATADPDDQRARAEAERVACA
jgi:molybdopterin synthase catalytic subunit